MKPPEQRQRPAGMCSAAWSDSAAKVRLPCRAAATVERCGRLFCSWHDPVRVVEHRAAQKARNARRGR